MKMLVFGEKKTVLIEGDIKSDPVGFYDVVIRSAIEHGEKLDQACVEVAEDMARAFYPSEDLKLGENPPIDKRILPILSMVMADPLWDQLGKNATCDDYWEAREKGSGGHG